MRKAVSRRLLLLSVAAAVCAPAVFATLTAQQPEPTFKTNVNAIVVDFRVVDGNGAFVDNLTSDDVQVFEDGKLQSVSSFDLVRIPMGPVPEQTFAGRRVAPDTQTNEHTFERAYVLMLDDRGQPLRSPTVRAIAKKFVTEYMRPEDLVALTTTSGRPDMQVEFTSDKVRLTDAIDKYVGGYGDPAANPLFQLRAVARWLSFDGHRKPIVLISERLGSGLPGLGSSPAEGLDLMDEVTLAKSATSGKTIFDEFTRTQGTGAIDLRDVIAAAERNNVTIYAIDPSGLPGTPFTDIKPTPYLADAESFQANRPGLRSASGQDALAVLAAETGGAALLRSNNFDRAFMRIVEDTSSYYLLAYTSSNDRKDGTFRRIDVRVRPGLYVRARAGYVAASATPVKTAHVPAGWTNELLRAVRNPVPVSGLTMDVGAVAFRQGHSAAVEVVVETRPNGLGLAESGSRSKGAVGFALAVADSGDHIKASQTGDLDMDLTSNVREEVDDYGVRFLTRFQLKPGKYTMRVASADSVRAMKGVVTYPLDVPDFSKGPITMSGLLLESPAENHRPTTGQDKDWQARFAKPPTAARRFSNRDEVTLVGEVYNNGKKDDSILVTTTVRDETDAVVFKQQDMLTGADTYARRMPISLKDFAAGKYLLTMEARNLTKAKAITSQQLVFSVTP